eukprot:SAG31_NODE_6031_length_2202_cov_3.104186_3_plen_87_part_00
MTVVKTTTRGQPAMFQNMSDLQQLQPLAETMPMLQGNPQRARIRSGYCTEYSCVQNTDIWLNLTPHFFAQSYLPVPAKIELCKCNL